MLFKNNTEDTSTQGIVFHKMLITAKPIIALANNNLIAGFYAIMLVDTSAHSSSPSTVPSLPDSGHKQEFLLGRSSNDPCFLCAKFTSLDTAKLFTCIVDTN